MLKTSPLTTRDLRRISAEVRQDVVRMHQKGSNVGSAMSAVDLLVSLYFSVMHIPSPAAEGRDRFILSKGHAAAALYGVLAKRGFFDQALLSDFQADGSLLSGHPVRCSLPGIEVSTGSLGHGLPMATGIALAAKKDGKTTRVFVLLGDGELQEGSVWEGAALAARFALDNLVAIVDANRLQGYGRVDDLMPISSFASKWRSFGWETLEINGHDHADICKTLSRCPFAEGKPSAVIAHTIKGKGVQQMEDQLAWHYLSVPPEKVEAFILELEMQK